MQHSKKSLAQIAQDIVPMIWLDATEDQMQQMRFDLYAKQRDIWKDPESDYHTLDQLIFAIRGLRMMITDGASHDAILKKQTSILLALPFYLNLYAKNGGKFYDFEGELVTTQPKPE